MLDLVMLLGGGILLYFGAEWLVGGAAGLANALGIRPVLVGLTVVAYGTSAPEAVVGFQAAYGGHGALALGNVIGSNIANLGLILGATALVSPPRIGQGFARRDILVLLGSTLVVPLLLQDGKLGMLESFALLACSIGYTGWVVSDSLGDRRTLRVATVSASVTAGAADEAGAPAPTKGRVRLALTAAAGLAVLVLGGDLLVVGAAGVARTLGMSERLIGLTVVSVGTSLPELAASLLAARRGHSEIALGNIIGSNIFNVLFCLGISGVAGSIEAPLETIWIDIVVMLSLTAIVSFMIWSERLIGRAEGALLAVVYACFLGALVLAG